MSETPLPSCTEAKCAPCNIAASTMCFSFPYHDIDNVTSTVSVIPYITQYEDGGLSTSFSTITVEDHPDADFFDEHSFTWVTHGRTLTYPTTYGSLTNFVGRADAKFEPTKTSNENRDCDGTVGTTAITLPATFDPGSFIIPLGVSSPTLKIGPLPESIIDYLNGLETVKKQLNNIPLTSCLPALPVHTICTTVLTSVSTHESCASETEGEQSCTTVTETLTETNTHTPHWPTLEGSATDLKRTAARLTTTTEEARTVTATAEPALVPTTSESEDSSSSQPATSSQPEQTATSKSMSEISESSVEIPQSSTAGIGTESNTSPELTTMASTSTTYLTRSSSASSSQGSSLGTADTSAASSVVLASAWRSISIAVLTCLLWY